MDDADILVIGGGIAGLSAALSLQASGARFLLVESGDRLGGVIRTERRDGFVMEAGPDAILAQKPEGVALCRELGLQDRLVPANAARSTVFVLVRGRLHAMPDGLMLGVPSRIWPMVKTGLFSWPAKLRMAGDLALRPRPGAEDESIASFLRRHFGPEVVERLGEPLLAGIHSGDPDRLSMASTFPRFVEMERRTGSLIRALRRAKPAPKGTAAFVSLQGGLQELVDAAAARLPASSVRTGWAGDAIHPDGAGWRVSGPAGSVRASRLIVAVPPSAAARLLGPVDAELASLLAQIRSVSTAVVHLGYRREDVGHPLEGFGVVVPVTEGLRTKALSFVSSKFPGRAPEGHVLVRGFLGGARDPQVLEQDDQALARRVHEEFTALLDLRAGPELTRVFRWPQATPQLEVGHAARVRRIESLLSRQRGVFLTGAGLRGTGIPDMIADGSLQATRALAPE
jgi:protoporphyrinogen/coproporphyrinogen III oxidase